MARTALSFAGAAVGSIFGPVGAQIGWALGSMVGGYVDPQVIQGPKIGETAVQTSRDGVPRPIVYGTAPVVGNIIARGPLEVVKTRQRQGKGGGPVVESEEAYLTFAVRICEGPIEGVLRIWEDEKLVYDVRPNSATLQDSAKYATGFTLYLGDEAQLPDSELEAIFGVGDTPAYRGSAYIVFRRKNVTDRRGSVPQLRFEVYTVAGTSVGNAFTATHVLGGSSRSAYIALADDQQRLIYCEAADGVSPGGTYTTGTLNSDLTVNTVGQVTVNTGSPGDNRLWLRGVSTSGHYLSADDNFGYCEIGIDGTYRARLEPTPNPAGPGWWYGESFWSPEYGGLVWFHAGSVFLGVRRTTESGYTFNSIFKFPTGLTGYPVNQTATAADVGDAGTPPYFWMHVDRHGVVRAITSDGVLKTYSSSLALVDSTPIPAGIFANGVRGFGVDGDVIAIVTTSAGGVVNFYRLTDWALLSSASDSNVYTRPVPTRVVFASGSCYVQRGNWIGRVAYTPASPGPVKLSSVVSDVCSRSGLTQIDVAQLTDDVAGVVLAGLYTGADAIRSLQRPYFFDPCETDGILRFVKRGGAVSVTLTDDDLIDADEATREQEVEYPRKMHLAYQHANSGYVPTKATVSRSSPDIRVVGEVTAEVPVVLSENDAAQTCDKMLKIAWVDAKGEVKFSVSDQWLGLTATDCIHLTRRGATRRLRIEKVNLSEGVLQIEAREDRQSAYTSNLSGLQLPAPTPPPSQIPGATHFEFLNLPALRDDDDRLGYYVGAGQILSAWAGAVVELSVGNADDFARVLTVDSGTVFGTLTADLPAASAEVTDTTNTIHIQVNEDVLESSSQVLNEKNACAIVSANGTEILQFTTATLTGTNTYELTGLVRGGLNTTPVLHASGARFVLLDTAYFVPAGSPLIGAELFHRATSYGNNPDESTVHQDTFSPANTQREWPVYGLAAARDGSDNVTVSWMPRHRFGAALAPVPSVNFDGWQITFEKSGTSKNYFIAAGDKQSIQSYTYTAAQATADLGSATGPINITVAQLNRITGAGETSQVSA